MTRALKHSVGKRRDKCESPSYSDTVCKLRCNFCKLWSPALRVAKKLTVGLISEAGGSFLRPRGQGMKKRV